MINITQKTISIPEELYIKLKKKKLTTETFPELIQRLLDEENVRIKRHRIKDLEGSFGDDSDEWDKIQDELYKDRLRPSSRKIITFDE